MSKLPKLHTPNPLSEKGFSYAVCTPRDNGCLYIYESYPSIERALDHMPIQGLPAYIAKYRGASRKWEDFIRVMYKWSAKRELWVLSLDDSAGIGFYTNGEKIIDKEVTHRGK